MGGPNTLCETLLLQLKLVLLYELSWRHTDILYVSDRVSLWQACIMHRATIPEDEVARLHIDLDHFAAAIFEPLQVVGVEQEEIAVFQFGRWCVLVCVEFAGRGEKLVEELGRAFH